MTPPPELPLVNGTCEVPNTSQDHTGSSSESGDEEDAPAVSYEGYQLLSQLPTGEDGPVVNGGDMMTSDDEEEEGQTDDQTTNAACEAPVPNHLDPPPTDPMRAEREERAQLWAGPGGRDTGPLDEQQVLQAMAGFSLPNSAVPAWARTVPEGEWRARLDERLQAWSQGKQPPTSN